MFLKTFIHLKTKIIAKTICFIVGVGEWVGPNTLTRQQDRYQ